MIDHLIICLKDYKTEMDYKKLTLTLMLLPCIHDYASVYMALAFDVEYFGPVDSPESSDEMLTKEEEKAFQAEVSLAKSLIKIGYNRIKEKIWAIRKAYNKAVTNGTRSGSEKIVQEHYDQLAEIWKGSPATEQFEFIISSNTNESTISNTSWSANYSSLQLLQHAYTFHSMISIQYKHVLSCCDLLLLLNNEHEHKHNPIHLNYCQKQKQNR